MRARLILGLAVAAPALLAGCASGPRAAPVVALSSATASLPSVATSARSEDYRLAPRDEVVFRLLNETGLETTQRLTATGELTLPLLGAVPIAGLTLREAEQTINEQYRTRGMFVAPQAMLSVVEYGERFVTVLGQVERPARVPLPIEAATFGVLEAVTQAGGFTRIARTDAVRVTRRGADGREEQIVLDVHRLLQRRRDDRETADFQLQPGDVVFVPERVF